MAALAAVAVGVGVLVPAAARLASPSTLPEAPAATRDVRGRQVAFRGTQPVAVAGAAIELERSGSVPALGGTTATRYQQTIDGIPVVGGEVAVQLGPSGRVLSSAADVSRAGSVDTTPSFPADRAADAAVAATARARGIAASGLEAAAPELWVYDPSVLGPPSELPASLTWRTEVTGPGVRQFVLVDAHTGGIALSFDEIAHGLTRQVCDGANTRGAEACTSPYARVEGQGTTGIAQVDQAYDFMGATYAFFDTRFGRDGITGNGDPILAKVRFCPSSSTAGSCPYDNAFWNGSQLTFGDGFATDDVVAHELAHGVTEHTADLFYWYQSGAINESMSDVFGELVDLTTGTDPPSARWLIGEDLAGGAIRSMSDPPAYGSPDRMTSSLYTADTDQLDRGGVHTNSGVGNKTAALITDGGTFNGQTITGLGIDKTAAVYYQTLTTLLTSASDYEDLGAALPQACANLVTAGAAGLTAADCQQVSAAVAATELASQPTTFGATAPEAPVCDAGTTAVDLFSDDLENTASGNWARAHTGGVYDWVWPGSDGWGAPYATSGTVNFWGADTGDPNQDGASGTPGEHGDATIAMTQNVLVPPGAPVYLRFRHAWAFDTDAQGNWDGGIVEYSTDNGPWQKVGVTSLSNGYNGLLVNQGTNPLRGQYAFVGNSHGYRSSRADLSALANHLLRVRFRVAEDSVVGSYGWFVDDVRLYSCVPVPDPAASVAQTADQTTVVAGEDVDLHLIVQNTGNVALTNVTVAGSRATECDRSIPVLAPSASEAVDCSHPTVAPDDVGTWTNTVTVDADELSEPVTSNRVSVTVDAPAPALSATLLASPGSVTAGDTIDLDATVENTGNVALTGVTVVDPDVPGCAVEIGTLAVGASQAVECQYQTVDPDDVGPWTHQLSVDADQLETAVASNEVSVAVLAPNTPALSISQAADESSVAAGTPVHLHVTVTNEGNVALSDVAISADSAPECAGPVGGLAIGAQVTVDCSHTPTDLGTWSSTASATSSETPTPQASNTVEVEVTDSTDPTVTLTSPSEGQVVDQGEVVVATYTCADTGAGVASCEGDVAPNQPIDTSTPGAHTFTVRAEDLAGNDASVTHAYTVAGRQPDARVQKGSGGAVKGDGIYNVTGADQTMTAAANAGRTVTFLITAQNDGTVPQALRVHGPRTKANFTARYTVGTQNVTTAVVNGTYQTPVLEPGAMVTVKLQVTIGRRAARGSSLTGLVTVTSMEDPTRSDAVKVIAKRR